MIRLGKTKDGTEYGFLTAKEIIRKLHARELCKHSATLKCTYCTMDVKSVGTAVRLLF